MKSTSTAGWTGAAAVAAGLFFLLSNLFGEFLFPAEDGGGEIVNLGLFLGYVAAWGLGALALVLTLRGFHRLVRERSEMTRAGSIGLRVAASGAAFQALFAAVTFATAAATGDSIGAAYFLYALGFLLLTGGSLTAGISMIRSRAQRRMAGLLLVLTAAAAIAALTIPEPVHDVALLLFAGAVIGGGIAQIWPLGSGSAGRRVRDLSSVRP